MKIKDVAKISFLFNGERIVLTVNRNGKFKLPTVENYDGILKKVSKHFSPREVVEHNLIKSMDPFLTLSTGEKIRVYQGGDPSYMLVEVESILDNHRKKYLKLREKINKSTSSKRYSSHVHEGYPWFDVGDVF